MTTDPLPQLGERTFPERFSPVTDSGSPERPSIANQQHLQQQHLQQQQQQQQLQLPASAVAAAFPCHNQQVMSPRAPHSNFAAAEPSSPLQTATLVQATRLEIPTSVLQQFAEAASLDASLIGDLRAAVVELNDRLQHRSNVLGGACVTLHSGYNALMDNLDRLQQGMDAHSRTLACLMNENQSLGREIDSKCEQLSVDMRQPFAIVREQLSAVQAKAEAAKMGPQQWQAQIEARIVQIQSELSGRLDDVRALSQSTASRLEPLVEAAQGGLSTMDGDVSARLKDLAAITEGVRDQMGAMKSRQEALTEDITGVKQELQAVAQQQVCLHEEVMQLQTLCEHFWIADAEEQGLPETDAEVNAYEQEWWGAPAGWDFQETGPAEDVAATAGPECSSGGAIPQAAAQTVTIPSAAGEPHPSLSTNCLGGILGSVGGIQGYSQPPPGLSVGDGVAAATPARTADSDIHHGRWKLLQEVPDLNLGSGEPWEFGMRLRTWTKQVEAVAGTIAPSFSDYVKSQFQLAEHRHQNRMAGLADYRDSDPLPKVRLEDTEKENRLVLLLIRCLPAELKQSVMEKHGEDAIRAADLLGGVLEILQPGGAAEMQSLHSFIRSLQPVQNARDGLSILRRWKLARARAESLNLPQIAPYEELQALNTLIKVLEKRHDRFRTLLSLSRTRPEIIRPTRAGVETTIALIDQQLQLISADEQTRTNSHVGTDPHAAKGKGKGKGSGKTTAAADKPCMFLQKFGKCKFGDKCYFKHEGVTKSSAANQTTSVPTPTTSTEVQLCQLWTRTGKCKFGDNCKL